MKEIRNQKGITLVALVVTIIVLIILAGISINLLLGDNGLITKAKEAKKQQKIAEIKEKISLELSAAETDAIIRNESLEEEQLNDIVSKYGTLQDDKDTILTKDDNYKISLKEIWYGTLSTSGSYSDKKKQIEMIEKELKELQDKYNELEQINSGNSEVLNDLRNQITTLENEKKTLEDSLKAEQDKNKTLEVQMADLNNKYDNLKKEYDKFINNPGTATADKILKDYKAYSKGQLITGTMANNGALNKAINAGESFTIPAGYTTGGKVTGNSLASQTGGTATADNISKGKTAWVNGAKVTGTGKDNETKYNEGTQKASFKISELRASKNYDTDQASGDFTFDVSGYNYMKIGSVWGSSTNYKAGVYDISSLSTIKLTCVQYKSTGSYSSGYRNIEFYN